MATRTLARKQPRTFDAARDPLDFRDRMFVPTLVEVPTHRFLSEVQRLKIPVLDQGSEGACTGFGLATVAHFLLRSRRRVADRTRVSARMLYEMAKRYDEWPGEGYNGSTARAAMKGWHKHGLCSERAWPYDAKRKAGVLDDARAKNAMDRPLGAYFRVNHKDLIAMHSAITEVGVLYATCICHAGWEKVAADGKIPFREEARGGHAFAIVGYDARGFWLQNSWGTKWGKGGFAHLTYDDWLQNGTDVWVARLGAPVEVDRAATAALVNSASANARASYSHADLRPHIISIGNDGELRDTGSYGTSRADVAEILGSDFPRLTKTWKHRRILLYAHGGLVGEDNAIQRAADYRATMMAQEIYPIAFIWKTDAWSTISNILRDALARRRPEGFLGAAKDFMLDRLDDALEPLARGLGKPLWSEMRENAQYSSRPNTGGAWAVLEELDKLLRLDPTIEVHVAGHSAGSIFMAGVVQRLAAPRNLPIANGPAQGATGLGKRIGSLSLWAPACTTALFKEAYLPALSSVDRFALYTLTDRAEQDDHCAKIYNKSLLYLVSNALDARARIPVFRPDGEPILGMAKFVEKDSQLSKLFGGRRQWIQTPNEIAIDKPGASRARAHGDFDDDEATVRSTILRILDTTASTAQVAFQRSASSMRDQRKNLA